MPCEISIVVPVFNEEENILPLAREVAAAFRNEGRSYELVFVDDASTDGTWEKIHEARKVDRRVRGLRHLKNAGQSAALWSGIQATVSPIVATLDGDLQNDPADLPGLLGKLGEFDFVCGKRTRGRILSCDAPHLASPGVRGIWSWVWISRTPAAHCGRSGARRCKVSFHSMDFIASFPSWFTAAARGQSKSPSSTGRASLGFPSTGYGTGSGAGSWICSRWPGISDEELATSRPRKCGTIAELMEPPGRCLQSADALKLLRN